MEFGETMAEVWTVLLLSPVNISTTPLLLALFKATYLTPTPWKPLVGFVKMDGGIGTMEY